MSNDELFSRRGKIMKVDHAENRSYYDNAIFFEQCQSFAINRLNNHIIRSSQYLNTGLADNVNIHIQWVDILKGIFNR